MIAAHVAPVLSLRPRLLEGKLVRLGVPAEDAAWLVRTLDVLESNAQRYQHARLVLRPRGIGPTTTRQVLQTHGYWHEPCARSGCARELGAKKAIVLIKGRGFCSVSCALEAIGAVP